MKKQLIISACFICFTSLIDAQTLTNSKTTPVESSAKKDTLKPIEAKTIIVASNRKDGKGTTATPVKNNSRENPNQPAQQTIILNSEKKALPPSEK